MRTVGLPSLPSLPTYIVRLIKCHFAARQRCGSGANIASI